MTMDVPPAPVARAGFQYFRRAEVALADMGTPFCLTTNQIWGAVVNKKTTASKAMVLRFFPDSREISFRIDDCQTRNRFGGYSPSE
jgi:type IV secretory pathway VirB9-like protein